MSAHGLLARPPGEGGLEDRASTPCLSLPGCELNQEKRTWTFKAQKEGKQDCKVLLNTVGAAQPQGRRRDSNHWRGAGV